MSYFQLQNLCGSFLLLGCVIGCAGAVEDATTGPYQFVETKAEAWSGQRNVMDLYAFSGAFDLADLTTFCQDRKQRSTASAFYYVVIFDDAANARFPTSPFTAEYGIEEDALRHIRAMYVYNKLNGFSELQYYDRNAFESAAKRENI